jgi:hypothetical protein
MTRAISKRPCINLFITYFARADNMLFPFTRGQITCYCPRKMLLPWRQITRRKLCFYYTCKFGVISIKYVIMTNNMIQTCSQYPYYINRCTSQINLVCCYLCTSYTQYRLLIGILVWNNYGSNQIVKEKKSLYGFFKVFPLRLFPIKDFCFYLRRHVRFKENRKSKSYSRLWSPCISRDERNTSKE